MPPQLFSYREDPEQSYNREDDWNYDGLHILRTGLVGVSREICNVQTQGGVITQHSIEVYELFLVREKHSSM